MGARPQVRPEKPKHRVKFLPREKTAYLMLRNKGYSISILSKVFGRSTSVIHKILKNASYVVRHLDLRKIPAGVRSRIRFFSIRRLMRLRPQWEAFILGEGDEPP